MFWDSSALVPCLIKEARSPQINKLLIDDKAIAIWWGTPVECASALERKRREGLPQRQYGQGLRRLAEFMNLASQVLPTDVVRDAAIQLLQLYRLRAADALQLAAAVTIPDRDAVPVHFVCLDDLLRDAATDQGFLCVP